MLLTDSVNFCAKCSTSRQRRFYMSLRPRRVLVVSKLSALEFLKARNPGLNEKQLHDKLIETGKNPEEILHEHNVQLACEERMGRVLRKLNIGVRVMKKIIDASKCVEWADMLVPIGGDGTFLHASKLIRDRTKPILGINPIPGLQSNLTLPKEYTENIQLVFEKLFVGEFAYRLRSRIRTVMNGEGLYGQPFHVHEERRNQGERRIDALIRSTQRKIADALQPRTRVLPWLALNEVFMGEFLSARASTLVLQADDGEEYTTRSSGICVCTGTGSSTWYRSMNIQSCKSIRTVVNLAMGEDLSEKDTSKLTQKYNTSLTFAPEDQQMAYMIREMYRASSWPKPKGCPVRGKCRKLMVKSLAFDAGLVLDGGISLPFNDGTTAAFEVREQDALRTIVLK